MNQFSYRGAVKRPSTYITRAQHEGAGTQNSVKWKPMANTRQKSVNFKTFNFEMEREPNKIGSLIHGKLDWAHSKCQIGEVISKIAVQYRIQCVTSSFKMGLTEFSFLKDSDPLWRA
jgi:hypothetical protein